MIKLIKNYKRYKRYYISWFRLKRIISKYYAESDVREGLAVSVLHDIIEYMSDIDSVIEKEV